MTGIFGIIATPMGALLSFLYGIIGDYGVAIIVFTFIVKMALYPLYIKQTKSMAGMSGVQPKMKALQQKYANDKETLRVEMAKLQKEEGFNPAAGCLPMLIQMPIIMGLFVLLRNPLVFMKNEAMIFAVHNTFLWIPDLSQPDQWILPIIAGIATYFSFAFGQQQQAPDMGNNSMAGMTKMMKYIFPIMIVWMGRSFPAGLALYWAMSQIMQIFFNLHLKSIRKKIMEESSKKK